MRFPFRSLPLDSTRGDSEYDGEVDDRGREVEEAEDGEVVLGVSLVEPESERVPAGAAAPDDAEKQKQKTKTRIDPPKKKHKNMK